ncbi:MAG: histidine kinase [Ornithinimicrobium sp.]
MDGDLRAGGDVAGASGSGAPVSQRPQDPWDRYGWVMAGIWLIFLVYPIVAAATLDAGWVWRGLGISIIVAYAAVYLHGFIRLSATCSVRERTALGVWHLAVMLGLLALSAPIIGWNVLGMTPFIVSFAMFTLPLRWASAVYASTLLAVLLLPLTAGRFTELFFFAIIVGGVGVATGVVRFVYERSADHKEAAAQIMIAGERERVARDVHDVLGHSLTVISIKAELAERLLDDGGDNEAARSEVRQIHDLSRQALAEVRSTVGGLRIARLDEEVDAARDVLIDASIEASLPTDLSVVDPRHRIVLAWSLREAVTNVVRHSDAAHCIVEVGPHELVVTDDGRGMNGHREGNGIRGLRERVEAAGGTLTLQQGSRGTGSRLAVHL